MLENETFRKIAFAAIAVVLIGLGVWATMHANDENKAAAKPMPTPVATIAPTTGPSDPVDTPIEEPAKAVKIAQPLSNTDLQSAAAAAEKFLARYGKFDYREDAGEQLAELASLTAEDATFDVATLLPRGAGRQAKVDDKVTMTTKITFQKVAMTTAASATFLVRLDSTTVNGDAAGKASDDVSLTMYRSGGGWAAYGLAFGDEFSEE